MTKASVLSKQIIRVLVATWLVVLCATGAAGAQSAQNPAEIALAREQFTAGVEAARRGMWPEARSAFERSYALYAHPETLFNVAGARLKVGALVAAAEAYRGYVRLVSAAADPARVAQAKKALAEIEPRIAHATLHAEALTDTDVLLLDGMTLSRAAIGADLPVDPGSHEVVVMRRDERVFERAFSANEGERIVLQISVPKDQTRGGPFVVATPAQAAQSLNEAGERPAAGSREEAPNERPLVKNVWLWSAVGVAVVSGALATWFLTREEDSEEVRGNVAPRVVEIR